MRSTVCSPILETSSMRRILSFLMALFVIVVAGGLAYGFYRTLLSEGSPHKRHS